MPGYRKFKTGIKIEQENHESSGVIRPPHVAVVGIEGKNRAETAGWRSMPGENPPLLPAALRNTV